MSTPTVTIALKRAKDVVDGDVIRLVPNDHEDWHYVYHAARGDSGREEGSDVDRVINEELDGRYVLLRIAEDPPMTIGETGGNELHAWVRGSKVAPKNFGAPAEREDRCVVLREYDLVETQMLVDDTEGSQR